MREPRTPEDEALAGLDETVEQYKAMVQQWADAVTRERAASARITGPALVVGQRMFVQGDDGTIAAFIIRDESA